MADKQTNQSRELPNLNVKVDIDVAEALTGLKALQREAKKATQAMAELAEAQKQGFPLNAEFVEGLTDDENKTINYLRNKLAKEIEEQVRQLLRSKADKDS
ncbi:hypothetical protein NGI46_07880 [Peribacillus butanolivorans]|uniref:hypothetical protein n=1 Tax=Peribacillus butanolivorans TaxID=421767 RepID=UPI00207D5C15|nr:hypothetical protein [Peribacillus butanolivorans]MCO0597385.1 hypothetical protein [Peribacillus butanolivorans]